MPELEERKNTVKEMLAKAKEVDPDNKELAKIEKLVDMMDSFEEVLFGDGEHNCEECPIRDECDNANNTATEESKKNEPLYIIMEAKENSSNIFGIGVDCHTEIRSNGKPVMEVLKTLISETMKGLPLDERELKIFFKDVINETIERRNK